jgi:hypothetical protein
LDMVAKGRHGNANKTHCRRGHEYTTENTYLHKHDNTISRSCKQCILDSNARRRDRLKAEGAASNG